MYNYTYDGINSIHGSQKFEYSVHDLFHKTPFHTGAKLLPEYFSDRRVCFQSPIIQ